MGQSELTERDLLSWLGGYFDHGALCKVYERRMGLYWALGVHILVTAYSEEMLVAIRDLFAFEKAKVKKRGKAYVFEIRRADEALSFAYQLLPFVKIRKKDLENVIEIINQWVDRRVDSNIYRAQARMMVERVLDVRAAEKSGKFVENTEE